ncbi:MAG: hypothetical protein IPM92_08820 [Saprospiraceae bacterium]|nr:hypothetical protein [Saprospiraceae bacterium]
MNATQIKLSLSCLLVASIFCNLVAQPEQDAFIPCHHAQQHLLYRHKPSELDIQLMENSNRRSDSIDIINYTIDIDITNYSGKSIKANTKVSFVPKQ